MWDLDNTLYRPERHVIAPWTAPFWPLVPMVAVPVLVGVARALPAGSAVVGRRIARLAALSAGLGLYLYGTIAVAVLGAGGPPGDRARR